MENIQALITNFRRAIDIAKRNGEFDKDCSFSRFSNGCCGDASDLLGMYLLKHGVRSSYVCGNRYFDGPEEGTQSHAWLDVNGWIADITGDQFRTQSIYLNYNIPDYYGPIDDFHRLFDVEERDVSPFLGFSNYSAFCQRRLYDIYGKIIKYM